jgi:hypothetical protein
MGAAGGHSEGGLADGAAVGQLAGMEVPVEAQARGLLALFRKPIEYQW